MTALSAILLATAFVSLLSFSGVLVAFFRSAVLSRFSVFFVALAAGALIGTAFLHLLPEAVEGGVERPFFLLILGGFVLFFLVEKTLHWHHAHLATHERRHLGVLSLVGDFLHNFIDGLIIAAAFLVDVRLGVTVTAAMALHEIPQEVSEFGVLLYAGFARARALFLNFFSATSVILGGAAGFFFAGAVEQVAPALIAFAVGSFLYLGASDFVPEIRKEEGFRKSFTTFLVFVGGIVLMWLFTFLE